MAKPFPHARRAAKFLSSTHARMKSVIDQVGPVKISLDPDQTLFRALATSIVYQQLHGKAAASIVARFVALYSLAPPDAFPEPAQVVATKTEQLRSAGLSAAKAGAIQDLARKILEGNVPDRAAAESMSNDEIIAALTSVKGIGRWTVEMFLIFTLGRTDVFPIHDYGVRKGYAAVFRKKELPTPKAFETIGKRWQPYRSAAAWYFWRALELPEFQVKNSKKNSSPESKRKK